MAFVKHVTVVNIEKNMIEEQKLSVANVELME